MKHRIITIILIIILIAGVSLLLYPTFSNWWNTFHGARLIANYESAVGEMKKSEITQMLDSAEEYNKNLASKGQLMVLPAEQMKIYKNQLKVKDSAIMGYVEISKLHLTLPMYHGTSETVLNMGVGHMEWSSLPVGGKSTHCVLSGHRGLMSARLFTDIDKLREGDLFVLKVLGKTLTYEIDQIRTVIPQDTTELMIEEGKDYCTLVTCTPYGVNTHRLLVRGHRVANVFDDRVVNEAIRINPIYVALAMAIIILIVIGSYIFRKTGRKSGKKLTGGNDAQKF